ncbi:MAG TPA: hypothetical protein VGG10_15100 [Rhizomicrobium sp.]|jgi:hypothetical protein
MKRPTAASAAVLAAFLPALLSSAPARAFPTIDVVSGECTPDSHTAEGPVDSDLTKRHSRFFCDAAVVSYFDASMRHVMVQFSQKESHHSPILGFAGLMDDDGQTLNVDHIYLDRDAPPVKASDGACKFFFARKHLKDLFCAAKVDESGRRTVAIVTLHAAPGQ